MTLEQRVERLEKAAGIEEQKRYRVKSIHDIVLWLSIHADDYQYNFVSGFSTFRMQRVPWAWNRRMWIRCGSIVWPTSDSEFPMYKCSQGFEYLPEWVEEITE